MLTNTLSDLIHDYLFYLPLKLWEDIFRRQTNYCILFTHYSLSDAPESYNQLSQLMAKSFQEESDSSSNPLSSYYCYSLEYKNFLLTNSSFTYYSTTQDLYKFTIKGNDGFIFEVDARNLFENVVNWVEIKEKLEQLMYCITKLDKRRIPILILVLLGEEKLPKECAPIISTHFIQRDQIRNIGISSHNHCKCFDQIQTKRPTHNTHMNMFIQFLQTIM